MLQSFLHEHKDSNHDVRALSINQRDRAEMVSESLLAQPLTCTACMLMAYHGTTKTNNERCDDGFAPCNCLSSSLSLSTVSPDTLAELVACLLALADSPKPKHMALAVKPWSLLDPW